MRNVVWIVVLSVVSAALLLCFVVPSSTPYSTKLLSDVDTNAAFDELRSLEHTTSDNNDDRFNTAYSGMKALEKFADGMMQDHNAGKRSRHIARVKTSLLRSKGVQGTLQSSLPAPP